MENKNIQIILIGIVIAIIVLFVINNNNKEDYQPTQMSFDKGIVYPKVYENGYHKHNKHYKDCCKKCMTSLKNQESNTRLYYDKFRDLQNKVANLENQLTYTQDVLTDYKKNLAFCRRELTLKPTVAKCFGNYKLSKNSITGRGVELTYKN